MKIPNRILILGCGGNNENISVKQLINPNSFVVGMDINFQSLIKNQCTKNLVQMDGAFMGFKKNSFDCIYSYHALEHISDYLSALYEVKRVLKPTGYFLLGVPNKRRLVGYINSKATLSNKIYWNINDYLMRIKGKFENKYGAHAGFTKDELRVYLSKYFADAEDVTDKYYYLRYSSKKNLLYILKIAGLQSLLFPSVYFLIFKK